MWPSWKHKFAWKWCKFMANCLNNYFCLVCFLPKTFAFCKVCSGSHKRHNEQGATQCYQAFLVWGIDCHIAFSKSVVFASFHNVWHGHDGILRLSSFFKPSWPQMTFPWEKRLALTGHYVWMPNTCLWKCLCLFRMERRIFPWHRHDGFPDLSSPDGPVHAAAAPFCLHTNAQGAKVFSESFQ